MIRFMAIVAIILVFAFLFAFLLALHEAFSYGTPHPHRIQGQRDCSEEFDEGSFYQGGCNGDGQWHGFGFHRDTIGNFYVGEFINGEKHGEGTKILKDGCFYHGEFKEGKQHGRGFYRDENGNLYKGYFDNDEKHGPGSYKYANGDFHQGFFKRGKKHDSFGIYKYKNRAATYGGGFKDDKKHGYGVYIQEGGFYCGKWEFGKLIAASHRQEFPEDRILRGSYSSLVDVEDSWSPLLPMFALMKIKIFHCPDIGLKETYSFI